jgi:glycosyltransferase involved in cell wall biosynthesis
MGETFEGLPSAYQLVPQDKPRDMAKISNENFQPQRPRVLLLVAACNPYKGSDSGAGWGWAVVTAKRFETWVICRQGDQEDIARYLDEHGEIPGLHFFFLKESWLEESLKIGQPLYDIHYLSYNLWQRRAFKLAAHLHQELKFDLVHQVNRTGFREMGYLWKLNVPFVWGPVGGTQNYPWRFLKTAGVRGAFKEGLRSLVNVCQFRFSPRVRKALKKATVVVAANSEIQSDFDRVHGVKPLVLLETGLKTAADAPAEGSLQNAPLKILWSGQLKHHKALHLLLRALSSKPLGFQYELKILGDGPLRLRWQSLARRLGIDAHCHWMGWVQHSWAMQEYGWADVVVFTSLRDTSSNVVLEALSRGVPVICLDHQGVGDIVTDECGIKIPVTTPGEVIANLRDHLAYLEADRARLESLSRGALKRARRFLWSGNGDQMARIYWAAMQMQLADRAQDGSSGDVERRTQDNR